MQKVIHHFENVHFIIFAVNPCHYVMETADEERYGPNQLLRALEVPMTPPPPPDFFIFLNYIYSSLNLCTLD